MPGTRRERPFWQVIGVFDPDQTGRDFSYTVGLAARGLPELHMWARPTDGEDPGEDWKFNPREQGMLLNEFAYQLLDDTLAVGHTETRTYDDGAAQVTFRISDPVAPADVEAYQADPGARIWPIRWRLERAPEGPLGPVGVDAVDAVLAAVDEIRGLLDPARVPATWAVPAGAASADDLDPDGPYGPLTPLVSGYAALLASLDVDALISWCENTVLADHGTGPRAVLALTAAAARPVGRRRALEAAHDLAGDLVDHLVGRPRPTWSWHTVVTALTGPMSADEFDTASGALRHLLAHAAAATLATAVVADVATDDLRRAGYGPLHWAITDGTPADWRADPSVDTELAGLLAGLDHRGLALLGRSHVAGITDHDDYLDLSHRLAGLAVTRGGGPAPLGDLTTAGAYDLDDEIVEDINQALLTLSSALAVRTLDERATRSLTDVYGGVLPDLARALRTADRG